MILTKRQSAFLHDLNGDPLKDLQSQFVTSFGAEISGTKISQNIRTLQRTDAWKAGLAAVNHPRTPRELTQRRVQQIVSWLIEKNLDLSVSSVQSLTDKQFLEELQKVFGETLTADAFVQKARRAYGSWPKTLSKNKNEPISAPKKAPALSEENLIDIFNFLKHEDITWNRSYFRQPPTVHIQKNIDVIVGRSVGLQQVYRSALDRGPMKFWIQRIFGNSIILERGRVEIASTQLTHIVRAIARDGRFSLNPTTARFNVNQPTRELIERVTGTDLSLRAVVLASTRDSVDWKRTWQEALVAAGLEVSQIAEPATGKLKDTVKDRRDDVRKRQIAKGLRWLHARSYPLTQNAVLKNFDPTFLSKLEEIYKKPTTPNAFIQKSRLLFESWEDALSEIGVSLRDINKARELKNLERRKKRVLEVIAWLDENGFPLNRNAVDKNSNSDFLNILHEKFLTKLHGRQFTRRATGAFGSWENVLIGYGVTQEEVLRQKKAVDLKRRIGRVDEILEWLQDKNFPMDYSAVKDLDDPQFLLQIESVFGTPLTTKQFLQRAFHAYGSWEKALETIGYSKTFRHRIRAESRIKIITIINWLKENHYNLRISALKKNHDSDFLQKIEQTLGASINGNQFTKRVVEVFGSWDLALRQVELSNERVRRLAKEQSIKNKKLQIIGIIHWLKKMVTLMDITKL